jgi:hypothetical protein
MNASLFVMDISGITHRFHKRLSEWYLTCVMIAIGVLFLQGGDFQVAYEGLGKIAAPHVWGLSMCIVGGLRFVILAVNGSLKRGSPHIRAALAFTAAMIWAIDLGGLMAYGVPLQVGPFLGAAIILEMVNVFRAAQDARYEDDVRGGKNGPVG